MNNLNNWYYWEAEQPNAVQAPTSDPQMGATGGPPVQPQVQDPNAQKEDDVADDPTISDMPDEGRPQDFEQWRYEFFKLSIDADTNEMMSSIRSVRDEELQPSQRRFVEDNLQILLYRQDANVLAATREVRKLIKQDLDKTNPGTTVMQHITAVLEKAALLQQVLIKLTGFGGYKGELHRKFVAALLGAVQTGGGNKTREDLIYADSDEYSISISTRFYTQFGELNLGAWSLKEDDPDRYLTEPELDRLHDGSPEEKQVLRRRIIMESMAETFKERAYVIHCVQPDGTIYAIGWDLGTSLKAAYREGKLVVRGRKNQNRDAVITDEGKIIRTLDYDILYVRDTGETDQNGRPEMMEVPFMERRDSIWYLTAELDTIRDAASTLSGMFFTEMPYGGNPSDIQQLQRCVPDLVEMLNRRCVGVSSPVGPEKTPKLQQMEFGKPKQQRPKPQPQAPQGGANIPQAPQGGPGGGGGKAPGLGEIPTA